ncbi:putative phospholipase/carboxylesterase family protein [Acanthamoeba polyphaga mimivirus]|uniref:Putative phospholipase/carboxylesterase family protein n=1 Tax=Acanthamoeba polyphaga mimivirus TaxID=212035 RepID=A0A0G2Y8A1_MIMIV|nr:putative phospholipase/carboxylesterase family protein [Hirudovirus strain Sangsue]AKI79371.1 putative phospholipase/carboxylesterase family protein [Acanthamoeba polyphaga mimivirus]EJN41018.1 putative phospholipase/carboxylesterase family protein [Acanthamoeba polyphaga lentillevirus]UMZ07869.1 putative phospholipase/carboxylesterase family protein [Acanthamoeba polyphaga mimivirus]
MYKKILIILIIIIIVIISLIYLKNFILYQPHKDHPVKYCKFFHKLSKLTEPENIHHLYLKTPDNILLDTIVIRNTDTNKCIIYFHGNAGNIAMRYNIIKFLFNYASVIVFDYRSFGRSTGSFITMNQQDLSTDAETIWNYVIKNLHYNPNNISLFGESLGCSVAINLAVNISKNFDSKYYPHSLILNSPFYSLSEMVKSIFHKANLSQFGSVLSNLFREYQSDKLIPFMNQYTKIIIAHSHNDEIIPFEQGFKLYQLIANTHTNSKFIIINGSHNNPGLPDEYIYTLADLFNDW